MRISGLGASAVSVSLIVVAALALSVGAGTASAAATATLKIYSGCVTSDGSQDRQWDYTLVVQGTTSYQGEAREEIRLWGDDPSYDDLLAGPYTHRSSGGYFYFAFCVNTGTLNEDWGRDEIYAGIRVFSTATNQQVDKVETNRITNYF